MAIWPAPKMSLRAKRSNLSASGVVFLILKKALSRFNVRPLSGLSPLSGSESAGFKVYLQYFVLVLQDAFTLGGTRAGNKSGAGDCKTCFFIPPAHCKYLSLRGCRSGRGNLSREQATLLSFEKKDNKETTTLPQGPKEPTFFRSQIIFPQNRYASGRG